MIELRDVGHVHAAGSPWARRALQHVELDVAIGERIAVVGHNGAGKSTLAEILAGVLVPTEGLASLDGTPLDEVDGRLALVLQQARLQLLRPLVRHELEVGAASRQVRELTGRLGVSHLFERPVDQLSGGQQRLVALAGALLRGRDVLVLDEPFAGLDGEASAQLVRILDEIDGTVIVVTHDLAPLAPLAPRVVRLDRGGVS
ncbi:MAG: ABC transporter ATP-binding protein [Actinomycetota bacterium]